MSRHRNPRGVMDLHQPIAPLCVYTITHSERLGFFYNLGGVGELSEGKRWVRAEALLAGAQLFGMRFLVLFAAAEDTRRLIFHANLDAIRLLESRDGRVRTDYSFSDLTPFRDPLPLKTSLVNDVTRKPIPAAFSRPYLICQTPASLLVQPVEDDRVHQTHSRRLR